MSSPKGLLLRMLGSLVLNDARVEQVSSPAGPYRLVDVLVAPTPDYEPGDKFQCVLPSADVRTYTPIGLRNGHTQILVYLNGPNPGAIWAGGLQPGAEFRFIGPQRSLRLPPGPVVVIGDETSIGVAAAYELARPGAVRVVLAVVDAEAARRAAAAVGLSEVVCVSPRLPEAVATAALEHARGASIGLTGSARLIHDVRAALRAGGRDDAKVKTYWAAGRVGLD